MDTSPIYFLLIILLTQLQVNGLHVTDQCNLATIRSHERFNRTTTVCAETNLNIFSNKINVDWAGITLSTMSYLTGMVPDVGGAVSASYGIIGLAHDTMQDIKAQRQQWQFQEAVEEELDNLRDCIDHKIDAAFIEDRETNINLLWTELENCVEDPLTGESRDNTNRVDCFDDFMRPVRAAVTYLDVAVDYDESINHLALYEATKNIFIMGTKTYLDELHYAVENNVGEKHMVCDSYSAALLDALEDVDILLDWIYSARDQIAAQWIPPMNGYIVDSVIGGGNGNSYPCTDRAWMDLASPLFKHAFDRNQEKFEDYTDPCCGDNCCNTGSHWTFFDGIAEPLFDEQELIPNSILAEWRQRGPEGYKMLLPIDEYGTVCEWTVDIADNNACRVGSCNNHPVDRYGCKVSLARTVDQKLQTIRFEIDGWKYQFTSQYIEALVQFKEELEITPYCRGPLDCGHEMFPDLEDCDKYFERDEVETFYPCSLTNECVAGACCNGYCHELVTAPSSFKDEAGDTVEFYGCPDPTDNDITFCQNYPDDAQCEYLYIWFEETVNGVTTKYALYDQGDGTVAFISIYSKLQNYDDAFKWHIVWRNLNGVIRFQNVLTEKYLKQAGSRVYSGSVWGSGAAAGWYLERISGNSFNIKKTNGDCLKHAVEAGVCDGSTDLFAVTKSIYPLFNQY